MTTQDEARKQIERDLAVIIQREYGARFDEHKGVAKVFGRKTVDRFYLIPRDEMPATMVDKDGYVWSGASAAHPAGDLPDSRSRALAMLARADRLEAEQAKAEAELRAKRDAWAAVIGKQVSEFHPYPDMAYGELDGYAKAAIDWLIEAGINPEEEK